MENRDRDKMSRNTGSTEAGNLNRETSENIGRSKDESSADFGKNIGRSEDLENEPSRRSGNLEESEEGSEFGTGSENVGSGSSTGRQ